MPAFRIRRRLVPAGFFALCLLLAPLRAQAPAGVTKVTSVEGITEYRLGNGLRVVLFPDPTKTNATVNITYMVGSRHEDYGETGMAHLLEHLMFKGSKNHPDVPKELTDHGTRPNGTTWLDRTNYFETFTASEENLDWALSLEADRMVNSFIAKKDLDSEMTVVRNEFEASENNPMGVLFKRMPSVAFDWHNYGHSTIGARADIENVPIDRLQAFWRHFYQPDNALLVVAGKIDEARTLGLVSKYFGPIPRPDRTLRRTYTAEPVQDGERSVTLRRTGDTQGMGFVYKVPPGTHEEYPAIEMAVEMLTDEPSGRLYKALVDTKKAASIFAMSFRLKEPGMVLALGEVRKQQSLDDAKNTMLAVLDEIPKKPFTEEELDRVRRQWLKNFDLRLNNSEAVALNLSEWQAMGDWRLMFLYRDRVEKVTLAQVNEAYRKYFVPSNRTVGLFIPEDKPVRADVPAAPDISALLSGYKGRQAVAQGEAFDPSPANIDQRTIRGELRDGLKFSFINKKTRGSQVVASLRLHLGDVGSLRNMDTPSGAAAGMLMRGTARHTRQQIKDEFDRLKANVMVMGGGDSVMARIVTTRENLMPALALLGEVLKEPAFPADEFDKWKQEQLAGLESSRREPRARGFEAMQRHLNPYPKGDPRYHMSVEESIDEVKALTVEDAKKFHQGFYGASNAELAVIGDFDAEAVQKQASALFHGWKSPRPFARVDRDYRKVEPKAEAMEFADKANAMWVAGMTLPLLDTSPDYPALLLGNYILGGSGFNSKLFARIRGKEGLSYGVGSMFAAQPHGDAATFMAYAICAPENAPKVEASFKDELKTTLEKGYTADEVEAAKKAWLQTRQVSRANDTELVSRLNSNTFNNRTMAWDAELEAKVKALTPEQIRAAMRKYLAPGSLSYFRAGDFKKVNVAW